MEIGKGGWGRHGSVPSRSTLSPCLLAMFTSGMEKMLRNNVSLGAEASIAAGPVGRDARAATDAQMKAEILSYSRTQGLFAGINLSGVFVRADADDNADLSRQEDCAGSDVVMGTTVTPPAIAEPLHGGAQTQIKDLQHES